MPTPEPKVPDAVIEAIFMNWTKHCEWCGETYLKMLGHATFPPGTFELPHQILREMQWSALAGCWFVRYLGMTVGIELEGYIHT